MTVTRNRMDFADLSVGWEAEARQWIQWARTPGHDSYWRFHRDQFLRLLPPPGRQTLDIGCGEGRLARDLKELGHRIVGIAVRRLSSLPPESSTHRWTCVWRMPPRFRLMMRARIWRSPSCHFKISTGCLLPFKKQRAFWNQVGDFAWR